VIKYI